MYEFTKIIEIEGKVLYKSEDIYIYVKKIDGLNLFKVSAENISDLTLYLRAFDPNFFIFSNEDINDLELDSFSEIGF